MQRRRNVRKIMQEPNAVINKTNIQRRNQSSKIVRTTNNQAIATNISKNMQLRNSAEPSPSKVKYSTVPKLFPQETIYIIGGGPSLKNFNFKTLIGKKTIAMCGDGGFMLNLPDLWTAAETQCDVVFLVMNDQGYGVIKHIQESMYGGRKFFADLIGPNFEDLAKVAKYTSISS